MFQCWQTLGSQNKHFWFEPVYDMYNIQVQQQYDVQLTHKFNESIDNVWQEGHWLRASRLSN